MQVHEGHTAKKYQENCEMACIDTKSLLLIFSRSTLQDHGDDSYIGQGNDKDSNDDGLSKDHILNQNHGYVC